MRETAAGLRLVEGDTLEDAAGARALLGAMRCEVRWQQGHPREAIEIAKAAIRDAKRAGEMEALARRTRRSTAPIRCWDSRRTRCTTGSLSRSTSSSDARGRWRRSSRTSASRPTPRDAGTRRSPGIAARRGTRSSPETSAARRWQGSTSRRCSSAAERYDEAEAILPDARRVLRAAGRIPFALLAEMQQTRIMIERGELRARSGSAVQDL